MSIVEAYRLREEDTDLTIIAVLMAFFADHVMGVVGSTRRNYLVEFNDYLDEGRLKQRSGPRKTHA